MEDLLALILIFVLILIVVYGAMHLKKHERSRRPYYSNFACKTEWDPLAMEELGTNEILRYSKDLRFE